LPSPQAIMGEQLFKGCHSGLR